MFVVKWSESCSVMSDSLWLYAAAKSLQSCLTLWDPMDGSPPGSCPWDSPGKNTGVGCHFLLQCMKVKSESEVAQSYLTLRDPMDCSPPGSSIHGIFQARVLEWGAIAFSVWLYGPWNSPGQKTGVGCHSLLQGIFPTQGPNPGFPHCRQILYQLSHQQSPRILEWVAYPFSSRSSRPRNQTGVSCIAGRFFTSWATREDPILLNKKNNIWDFRVPVAYFPWTVFVVLPYKVHLVTVYLKIALYFVCVCADSQWCPTLCDPMDWSPPGSSVHGILQARILEWVAISSSRGSSRPRVWTGISCIGRQILSHWATREAPYLYLQLCEWYSMQRIFLERLPWFSVGKRVLGGWRSCW